MYILLQPLKMEAIPLGALSWKKQFVHEKHERHEKIQGDAKIPDDPPRGEYSTRRGAGVLLRVFRVFRVFRGKIAVFRPLCQPLKMEAIHGGIILEKAVRPRKTRKARKNSRRCKNSR
jgi:hypothetical protein